jgi:hypothetical protein
LATETNGGRLEIHLKKQEGSKEKGKEKSKQEKKNKKRRCVGTGCASHRAPLGTHPKMSR